MASFDRPFSILIVMLNSQSLSLMQKRKLWREQKEDKFKEIASSRSAMFNYFYNNNDIFKFIAEEDFLVYSYAPPHPASTSSNSWTNRPTSTSPASSE